MTTEQFINSPLNYTGGKFKLLSQLNPLFPKENINTFYDVFTGGGVISANADALLSCQKVEASDIVPELIELLQWFRDNKPADIIAKLDALSVSYALTNTSKNGYEYYKADSGKGVGSINKTGYMKLRDDYNKQRAKGTTSVEMFYLLIIYAFNNQIRFNAKGEFNLPVGKRDLNKSMRNKINKFSVAVENNSVDFICRDFHETIEKAADGDFLYCDPPYLITLAGYNENGGWNIEDDQELMKLLVSAHERGASFAMSNVTEHKGRTNDALVQWANDNGFFIHELNFDYNNSNYHSQAKDNKTTEVLITDYKIN